MSAIRANAQLLIDFQKLYAYPEVATISKIGQKKNGKKKNKIYG